MIVGAAITTWHDALSHDIATDLRVRVRVKLKVRARARNGT